MADRPHETISVSVETSGRVGSVALARGDTLLAARTFNTQSNHGVELLPTVDALCQSAGVRPPDVALVHISGGPGSFTGLRVGTTFAKTLALATGARLVRVPTLQVIAQNALDLPDAPPCVVVALDAKRAHIYSAAFRLVDSVYEPLDEAAERDPCTYLPALLAEGASAGRPALAALGEGIAYHRAAFTGIAGLEILPEELNRARAETVLRLGLRLAAAGLFTAAADLVPIYIRRPEAEEKWEERHAASAPVPAPAPRTPAPTGNDLTR